MNRCGFILILTALTLLAAGCCSPMQKMLAQSPGWEQSAQRMASRASSHASGLVKEPFPDLNNSIHAEIWNALLKKGKIGAGFGSISDYYGFYLVTVSTGWNEGWLSSFYNPTNHFVLEGSEYLALSFYGGDKTATQTNVVALVQHLLAVSGDEAFVVNDSDDIPHAVYSKDNPGLSFHDLLSSSGITIRPPSFVKKNEDANQGGYSQYSVFVYMPLGGRLYRYEVRYWHGRIDEVRRFLIDADIGDCSYIM